MSNSDNTEVNPEGVADEIRAKRQWMIWDSSAKTDRRPFGWDDERGTLDFEGSWKEPTDWLTFEEALEASRTKETYGIGYVFRENDEYVPLDVDGCYDENGDLKDWVPDLERFKGETYIEYSPSGDGLHILVEHPGIPPWWPKDNVHFSDEEHEGQEAYDKKFFTVTGDRHPESTETIEEVNPDGYLWNAFKNITGETPELDNNQPDSNSNSNHTTRDNVDVSVYDLVSKNQYPEGERCSHPCHSSGTGSNFHVDPNGETFRCWRHGTTGNAMHLLGMQENIINCGDWDGSDLTDSEWEQIFDAAREQGLDVPEKQDSRKPDIEATSADGGAVQMMEEEGEQQSAESEDEPTDPWEAVYQSYLEAELDDDGMTAYLRRRARYEATEIFLNDHAWISHEDSGVLYHYEDGIYVDKGSNRVENKLSENIREHYSNHERREVLNHLRGRTYVPEDEMGGPEPLICTQNSVLNLGKDASDPEEFEHSPEYNFLSKLGCKFDPKADCPTFKSALDDWISNEKTRMKLQEYAGYCLMHWGLPHHKVLFLVGPTASGKSTFLDTIRAMLGDGTVSSLTPQQLTKDDFDASGIYGKWVNIRNDIPDSMIENTGMFKEVAAGDPIKIEFKFEDAFEIEPKTKHMFSANQLPDANTDDEAFYRRILLAPFPSTVPEHERDKDLDDKLQNELPGVLNWALEGLQRLQEQGGFTGDLSPGRTQDTWDKWGHAADRFYSACIEEATGENIPKSDVYRVFSSFCEDENIPSCSQNKLTRRLKEEGVMDGKKFSNGRQQRCYLNVRLTSRGEDYLPDDDDEDGDHYDGSLDSY